MSYVAYYEVASIWPRPHFLAHLLQGGKDLPGFRYGPSPTEDYPHMSTARLEEITQTNGADGGGEADYQRQLADLCHMTSATDTTACVVSRVASCAPLQLKLTPFLAGLVATAVGNLRRAHDAANGTGNGTAGMGAGAGGDESEREGIGEGEGGGDGEGGGEGEDEGEGGESTIVSRALAGFPYAAVHWRRGDKCGATEADIQGRAVQLDPGLTTG